MIRSLVIVGHLIFCTGFSVAQPAVDIFDRHEKMSWLGLDFTAAKLVGDPNGWHSEHYVHRFMTSINNLMLKESHKYDIGAALNRYRVDYEIDVTLDHNEKLNMENATDSRLRGHYLKEDDIQKIVDLYDFQGLKGTGVMFIVEAFNKLDLESVVWVTFINLDNKEVLFTRRMIEQPSGFGLRNFWAGSIYKMIKQIRRRDYDRWRREYARKN